MTRTGTTSALVSSGLPCGTASGWTSRGARALAGIVLAAGLFAAQPAGAATKRFQPATQIRGAAKGVRSMHPFRAIGRALGKAGQTSFDLTTRALEKIHLPGQANLAVVGGATLACPIAAVTAGIGLVVGAAPVAIAGAATAVVTAPVALGGAWLLHGLARWASEEGGGE